METYSLPKFKFRIASGGSSETRLQADVMGDIRNAIDGMSCDIWYNNPYMVRSYAVISNSKTPLIKTCDYHFRKLHAKKARLQWKVVWHVRVFHVCTFHSNTLHFLPLYRTATRSISSPRHYFGKLASNYLFACLCFVVQTLDFAL